MAAVIGALRIELGANVAQFITDLGKAEKGLAGFSSKAAKLGDQMTSLGAKLTLGITAPILAFAYSSAKGLMEAEEATARVEAVLKTMGTQAGFTGTQLAGMAKELMKATSFNDDDILSNVTANLLTFGNVQGEVFARAQASALDLSAQFGGDLQSAAIQLGKALNDPIKGITALSRVGVSFSEEQKTLIKSLVETGRAASAQAIILDELDRQMGQAAETAGQTTAGQLRQLANAWGEVQDEVGKVVLEILPPLLELLQDTIAYLKELSPETKQWAIQIGLAAAAIGPAVIVIGTFVTALGTIATVIRLAVIPALIAMLANPIVAGTVVLGAGLGYLISQLYGVEAAADASARALRDAEEARLGATRPQDRADPSKMGPLTVEGVARALDGAVGNITGDDPLAAGVGVPDKPREKIRSTREVAAAARDLAGDIRSVTDAAKESDRAIRDFAGPTGDRLKQALTDIDDRYQDLRQELTRQIEEYAKLGGTNDAAAAGLAKLRANLVSLEKAHATATAAAKAQYAAEQLLATMDADREGAGISDQIAGLRDANGQGAGLMTQTAREVADIESQLAAQRMESARRVTQLEIDRQTALAEGDAAQAERIAANLALAQQFDAEVNQTTAAQIHATQLLRDSWTELTDRLSDQLSDMVMKWDFDLNTIRDTFADIAKQQFVKPFFESALGGLGKFAEGLAGGGGGGWGSLFGGGRADGGDVFAGMSYTVGERGVERFTPAVDGHITSNDKMGGGGTVVQNNYFKDVDGFAKSKRQMAGDLKRAVNFS